MRSVLGITELSIVYDQALAHRYALLTDRQRRGECTNQVAETKSPSRSVF